MKSLTHIATSSVMFEGFLPVPAVIPAQQFGPGSILPKIDLGTAALFEKPLQCHYRLIIGSPPWGL